MVPRVFGSQLPVVVGCGVRLGHEMPAASPQAKSARAMPMPNNESEPRTKLFLGAASVLNMMPVPGTRHVPRCGRIWHFELRSVCETDAVHTHEVRWAKNCYGSRQ